MNDSITFVPETAAFQTLNTQSPRLTKTLTRLVRLGLTAEYIIEIFQSQGIDSEFLLALIGCTCDYLKERKLSKGKDKRRNTLSCRD